MVCELYLQKKKIYSKNKQKRVATELVCCGTNLKYPGISASLVATMSVLRGLKRS